MIGVIAPTEELPPWERSTGVGAGEDDSGMPGTAASAGSWVADGDCKGWLVVMTAAALPLGWTGSGTLKVSSGKVGAG